MTRTLVVRSLRDGAAMLATCSALLGAFVMLRIFAASKLPIDSMLTMISQNLKFVEDLLPVSIADIASPIGRSAFSFEEMPVLALTALWAVARGSECIAGRVGAGTMELLLAQPIRRSTIVLSHTTVTLLGALVLAAAAWTGVAGGLVIGKFDAPPSWMVVWPAVANLLALQLFLVGAATLVGALVRSRGLAIGVMLVFYVVEFALFIVGRLLPQPDYAWVRWLTFQSAYEPTLLTIGVAREPDEYMPLFWQYNGLLVVLGLALLAAATAIFSRRDVPAPL